MRHLRLLGLLVATVLLFGLPAVLAVVLIDSPLDEDEPVVPVLVRPSTATVLDSRPATLTVALGEAPTAELLAAQGGVVTDIEVRQGDLVSTGDIMMSISGLSIYIVVGEAPLSRSVSWGSVGRDVITIREFLVATGHLAPESATSDRFDAELARAIADFNFARGVAVHDSVFSLDAVVWAPKPFIVSDLSVELGSAALGPGATVLAGEQPVLAVDIDASEIPAGTRSDFVFVSDGLTIPLADVAGEEWAPELRNRLEPAEDGSLVVYGSAELAMPRVVAAVPITSLLDGDAGSCVVTLESEPTGATSWIAVESSAVGQHVMVDGGDVGRSFLTEALPEGVVVLANPRLSEQDLCP